MQTTAEATATLRAKVSNSRQDERLPTRSIVHWSKQYEHHVPVTCGKCGNTRVVSASLFQGKARETCTGFCFSCTHTKRTDVERHPSGTLIYWALRDSSRRVQILCHGCKQRRFAWDASLRHVNSSGLCAECLKARGSYKRHAQAEVHSTGALVLWGERFGPPNSRKVFFLCADCKTRHSVSALAPYRSDWTGLCPKCRRLRDRIHGLLTSDENHPTGAIIHWGERQRNDQGNFDHLVPFTCATCNGKDITRREAIRGRWRGQCHECRRKRTHPCKRIEDERLNCGAEILWSKAIDQRVPVICSLSWCRNTWWISRCWAKLKRRDKEWTGYCPEHFKSQSALRFLIASVSERGKEVKNGPANGNDKRQHGGARNVKWTPDKEDRLLNLYEEMLKKIRQKDQGLPDDVKQQLLLPSKPPSDVARDYAAEQLGVESNNYLLTVLKRARKRREEKNAVHSRSILNVP